MRGAKSGQRGQRVGKKGIHKDLVLIIEKQ